MPQGDRPWGGITLGREGMPRPTNQQVGREYLGVHGRVRRGGGGAPVVPEMLTSCQYLPVPVPTPPLPYGTPPVPGVPPGILLDAVASRS